MEKLDRRTLLGAAAALPLLPKGLQAQWQQDEDKPSLLSTALADGERLAKPVLVLCIPADEEENGSKYLRGQALGTLLEYASVELLEALPLAEIVCARRDELQALRPKWKLAGEPFAWLVETAGASAPFTPVVADIGGEPDLGWPMQVGPPVMRRRLVAWVRPLDQALVEVLVGSEALVQRRAAAVNASGNFRVASRARLLAEPREAKVEEMRAGAALVYRASMGMDPKTCAHRVALRDHTRTQLIEASPAGAAWAKHTRCGFEIDGVDTIGVDCGMGYLSENGRRLLWFLTRPA